MEHTMHIECLKCGNDNQRMFDTWNHLRHQMDVNCQVCAHSWVHIFKDVPPDNIIPPDGVLTDARRR